VGMTGAHDCAPVGMTGVHGCAPVGMTGAHGCAPVGSKTAPWRQGFRVEKLANLMDWVIS
jgi:hypothetical protein